MEHRKGEKRYEELTRIDFASATRRVDKMATLNRLLKIHLRCISLAITEW